MIMLWILISAGCAVLVFRFALFIHKSISNGDSEIINENDYYDELDDIEYYLDFDRRRANIQKVVDYYWAQRAQDNENQIDYVKRWWGDV